MGKMLIGRRGVLAGLAAAIASPLAGPLAKAANFVSIPFRRRVYYPLAFLPFGVGAWQWVGFAPDSFPIPDDIELRIRAALADLNEHPTYLHVADFNAVDVEAFGKRLDAITMHDLLDEPAVRLAATELFG